MSAPKQQRHCCYIASRRARTGAAVQHKRLFSGAQQNLKTDDNMYIPVANIRKCTSFGAAVHRILCILLCCTEPVPYSVTPPCLTSPRSPWSSLAPRAGGSTSASPMPPPLPLPPPLPSCSHDHDNRHRQHSNTLCCRCFLTPPSIVSKRGLPWSRSGRCVRDKNVGGLRGKRSCSVGRTREKHGAPSPIRSVWRGLLCANQAAVLLHVRLLQVCTTVYQMGTCASPR